MAPFQAWECLKYGSQLKLLQYEVRSIRLAVRRLAYDVMYALPVFGSRLRARHHAAFMQRCAEIWGEAPDNARAVEDIDVTKGWP